MKKTLQVVMLPTNEKSKLVLSYCKELAINWTHDLAKFDDATYQHLYFLFDEEIKKGDWIYDVCDGIVKVEHEYQLSNMMVFRKDCKKIIATTDDLLFTEYDPKTSSVEDEYYLPEPPQSFIEHFVEEYNKGNVITEVEVEYEEGKYNLDELRERHLKGLPHSYDYCKLKINPDHTINILPKKESWSREEVIKFAERYARMVQEKEIQLNAYKAIHNYKWIEENL